MRTPLLIRIIIILNVLVFIGWFYSLTTQLKLLWMMDNFLVSWSALEQGRPWTLLTSVFSHSAFFHLLINMYVLRGFGTVLNRIMGTMHFLNFYLIAGITGSLMHALVSMLLIRDPALPALGASGAISGIVLLFSLMFPQERLLLLGIVPIRARWAALMIIAIDIWGVVEQSRGGGLPIGHGAHLGGAIMGILWFFWLKNRSRKDEGFRPF